MPEALPLQMTLTTAVADALHFRAMTATEEVSRLFELQVTALGKTETVAADDLLGTTAAVSLDLGDDQKRWFHGVVAAFGIDGQEGRHYRYRLYLRPWLWLLTRSANVRIFQDKTAPEIIKEVFGAYSGTFVDELSGTYLPRVYCVQYRETDFNFVSRLMEEEGIYYFFRHSEDKHELVLADAPTTPVPTPGFEEVGFFEDAQALAEVQGLSTWQMRHEVQTGKTTLSDYNFETPSTSLKSNTVAGTRNHAEKDFEVYDYPGLYAVKADGDARAQIRLDEHSSRFTRFHGGGNVPGLAAGALFKLVNHPRADQNAEYFLLATHIEMQQAGLEGGAGDDTLFHCSFTAQVSADPFRPARITRKPTVAGPQTAMVTGAGDAGDIPTDQYGRVKVQFHWDRQGQKDDQTSCWLRVATSWAGNGWGAISLPRKGQEVVVAFLEGDPDQPLIVGSVYNAEQLPPYELPANATVSTVKSRSKKGAAADFNELRFEDKPGSEYVLLHAQKDRLEFVEDTLRSQIDKDEHLLVKNDRFEQVDNDHHVTVKKDQKHKIGGELHQTVAKDMLFDGGGVWSLKTTKDITAEAGATISLKSATDMHLKIGTNLGADAGQNVHIKAGMNVVIEAGMQITLKAGGSSVVIGPAEVCITGPIIKLNSGGGPGSGAGASPVSPTKPAEPQAPEPPKDPLSHR
ncbi:MAG: type VI secretion system Vgr family protein [Rubrivivax sp.]|jgi:type VI secretion system secreted protein VgrG